MPYIRPYQCRDCYGYRRGRCVRDRLEKAPDTPACDEFVLAERFYSTGVDGYEAVT